MDIKILIAEDDQIFRDLVCDIVRKEGYIPVEACDGKEAIDIFFGSNDIDLIILDVMMPIYDGWEVLKEIREHSDVPSNNVNSTWETKKMRFLDLRKGQMSILQNLLVMRYLLLVLIAIVRKLKKEQFDEIIAGKIKINQATHKVIVDDLEVELNHKEYNLLIYFVKNSDRVLTREQILYKVWGYDFDGDIRTIDTHIKTLRAKLSKYGNYIKTVRGSGYMFEVENHEDN